MNSNNFVSGMQSLFNDFFYKYIEEKINPIYNNLNAHPEQLFNFIEHMSNFNNSSTNVQNQFLKTKDITIQNIAQEKSIKNEQVFNEEIKLDELKPTKLEELQKMIDKDQENLENEDFNIYTNLNTADKHIKIIGNKATFNNSGSNYMKKYWDLREHPFNLLTEQEQKENLIWSFEKFNKKEKVVPHNLDLDHENLMNYTEGIPENWNAINDDIKISSLKFNNNKIKLCNINDCEKFKKEDINQLISWKEDLTKIKIEEKNNAIDENKIQEEPTENDNFGICFFGKPPPETLFKYNQCVDRAYHLLKLQRDKHNAELNGQNVDSDIENENNDEYVDNESNQNNNEENNNDDINNLYTEKEMVEDTVKTINDLDIPEISDDINDYIEESDTDTSDTDTFDTDTSDTDASDTDTCNVESTAEELVDCEIEKQENKVDCDKHKSTESFLDSLDKELINYSEKSKIIIV